MSSNTVRLLGISGSLRKASCNTGMLRFVSANVNQIKPPTADLKIDFQIADISKLPLYNGDIPDEAGTEHEAVAAFRKQVLEADAFLFAMPEYNMGMTAPMKNAIDWASRGPKGNAWKGKAGGMISAGGGNGALRSQLSLRQSAVFLDLHLLNSPEVCIPRFGVKPAPFEEETGNFVDPMTQKWVMALTERLVALQNKLKK